MPKRRKSNNPDGRPATTGSKHTPVVSYRVSAELHAALTTEAIALGLARNELARQDAESGREARLRGIDITDLGDPRDD